MKKFLFSVIVFLQITCVKAQYPTYTNQMSTSGLNPLGGRILDIIDYNKDGYDDLFYQNGTSSWKLMRNNGDITFADVTVSVGLPDNISFSNVISTDFNNDGNWDILTWSNGIFRVFTSNNTGVFTEETSNFGNPTLPSGYHLNESVVVLSDYDNDGDNDILLTRQLASGERRISAYNNQISSNNGLILIDIIVGISSSIDPILSMIDYDNDADNDLLILMKTNIGGIGGYGYFTLNPIKLFANAGGNFTDVTVSAGLSASNVSHYGFANVVDLNNDGFLDFLVGTTDATYMNYNNNKNRYFKNNGNGTYTDITSTFDLYSVYGYYHNSTMADLNNNGVNEVIWEWSNGAGTNQLRIFEFNGSIYQEQTTSFGLNNIGAANGGNLANSCSIFDVNNDGHLDVFYNGSLNLNSSLQVNNSNLTNRYLKVKLEGCGNTDPRGTKVTLFEGGNSNSQFYGSNNSSSSYALNKSDSEILHFGVGLNSVLDSVYVYWTGGLVSKYYNMSTNQTVTFSSNDFTTDIHEACLSYTWPLNGQTYTQSTNLPFVVFTNINGCDSTVTLDLTINPLPIVNAGTDQILCQGQSTTLFASGADTYSWTNNVINGVGFLPTATQEYVVSGTTTVSGCANSDTVSVIVNELPTVNAGSDLTICKGDTILLSGSGALNYSWNNNVINGQEFVPAATQTYQVVGTDANNCSNNDQVTVIVNEASSSTLTETALDSYTLNGQTYTQSGTYTQVIPNAAGCDSTITLNLSLDFTGISELNKDFSIAPNPATNQLTISTSTLSNEKYILFDPQGRNVISGSLTGTTTQLDLSKLARGNYILQIGEKLTPVKLVKE